MTGPELVVRLVDGDGLLLDTLRLSETYADVDAKLVEFGSGELMSRRVAVAHFAEEVREMVVCEAKRLENMAVSS